jgi:blue copper oxidase
MIGCWIDKLIVTTLLSAFAFSSFAQNALLIPPILSGTTFNLNVQADSTEFFPGHMTPTYGVNGNILGPTLILNKGDNVTLNVTNQLATTTTMHWHGLHVPAHADGGPHQIIQPGTTWSPNFTVMNDAATYWYHPHGEHRTDLQVTKGLAGLIIIKDSIEASLNLPRTYGVDDFPIIVQTKCFDVLYQTAIATMFDTVPMINATINPYLNAPSQVIRFRLLNGSSDRSYMFGFSNNMNFHLIATDGGLITTPLSLNRLRLSPGERAEILIDLSSMQGQTIQLMNYGSEIPNGIMGALTVGNGMAQIPDYNLNPLNGADFNLLQINIGAPTANPVTTIPPALTTLSPWNPSTANRTRTILFAPQTMGMQEMVVGPFTMNGHQFSMDTINDTTFLNHIEIWTLTNQTLVAHPFHIHDIQFFITDVNGSPAPAYEAGKKDVVLVMPQQSVSFITKFEDFADTIPYMYHCHLFHHEDDGMMGSFVVLDSTSLFINDKKQEVFSYYPNPISEGKLNLVFSEFLGPLQYKFVNIQGQEIKRGIMHVVDTRASLSTNGMDPGLYNLILVSRNSVSTLKVVVE